jgi:hypothetical protein
MPKTHGRICIPDGLGARRRMGIKYLVVREPNPPKSLFIYGFDPEHIKYTSSTEEYYIMSTHFEYVFCVLGKPIKPIGAFDIWDRDSDVTDLRTAVHDTIAMIFDRDWS